MLVTTKAIVIASLKYGEADLIVKCFTQSNGLKSYLLRNILKSKKGRLRASMFQVLTQLEIVANHKDKGTLENIREAKIINPYQHLQTQIEKTCLSLFLAECLRNSIQEEETDPALYTFLETSFNFLDQASKPANFHLLFLVKLTQFLGFYPHQPNENEPVFNLLEGIFQKTETNKYCVGGPICTLLKTLLTSKFSDISSLELNQSKRTEFLEMLLVYYELHLHGFRKPKSLEVLNQVFG
ncbi:MAG TPA: DNA repair protein RecO [Flavobacteriaceae bacterium]|nr:DNA repair protein RecO [Flavobacteriaceae bacterium]